jgi:predicted tellurium resistance membrane protein TerC
MDWLLQPETWIAFITLVALELILGVDNVIFISILSGKLPQNQQGQARRTGILAAVITRVLLLYSLSLIIRLDKPFFTVLSFGISGKDLILLVGGLFLLYKSTYEIHQNLEGVEGQVSAKVGAAFWSVVVQIMLLDIVFSLDSVITAVGMIEPEKILLMVAAVVIAAVVMVFTSGPLARFVERHPTIKILALSFLLLIGFTLIVEALHQHIPKGYIYFAMAFAVFVEILNQRVRQPVRPVNLRDPYKQPRIVTEGAPVVDLPVPAAPKKKSNRDRKKKNRK